jgi:hypothetical protein
MVRLRTAESGFSRVEALVAMVLLSINIVGLMSMFVVAQDGIAGGARSLDMMALVESRIERLRTRPYLALLDVDAASGTVLKDDGLDGDKVAGDGEFSAREAVDGVVVTWSVKPDRGVLRVSPCSTLSVSAEWADQKEKPKRTVQLSVRRANPVYRASVSL